MLQSWLVRSSSLSELIDGAPLNWLAGTFICSVPKPLLPVVPEPELLEPVPEKFIVLAGTTYILPLKVLPPERMA